jgi:hypothetical protein
MIIHLTKARAMLVLLVSVVVVSSATASAQATEPPVKEIFANQIGWDVNKTQEAAGPPQADVCTALSKDECQPGVITGKAGGFSYPVGVAVDDDPTSPEHGDLYVSDENNHRVEVLTPAGGFVSMFGAEVNETNHSDICTAASGNACGAGEGGSEAGALESPAGIAIDPSTGDVYVQDQPNWRVDEYGSEGQFLAMFGGEVNEAKDDEPSADEAERNACFAAESKFCKTGVPGTPGAGGHGAFNFSEGGDVLTVAGPENILYVGDENRVQELEANGTWAGEIPVSGTISSLAVDAQTGIMYVIYNQEPVIHEFDVATKAELAASIAVPSAIFVRGIAIDSNGRLAVSLYEEVGVASKLFGDLYRASDGHLVSQIAVPASAENFRALSFGENGDLYGMASQEVLAYALEPVAEVAGGAAACAPGAANGSSATFDCTLSAEVNPEGVADTEALFEWGETSSLGRQTDRQSIAAPETVRAALANLRPNETVFYQLAAYDENLKAPEQLTTEERSLTTESVPPKVLGRPSASFVTSSSADLSGELNPEHTDTSYRFQYAKACNTGELCPTLAQAPGMVETTAQESGAYGQVGATAEVTALQPLTTYRYRLTAVNEKQQEAVSATGGSALPEGTFTTGPSPAPEASTGAASAVGASSATISGLVNPDGLPGTYSFELGVYEGAATQYGDVFSASAGTSSTPIEETLALTGLQPGTTYAYRVAIHSGYIHNGENTLRGATVLFTTAGVSAVLTAPGALSQLAIPAIAFQTAASAPKSAVACRRGYKRDKQGRCVKARAKRKKTAAGRKRRKRK